MTFRPARRTTTSVLIALLTTAGLLVPAPVSAEPNRFVKIEKKVAPFAGNVFSDWAVGHSGSFSIVITNTTSLGFALFAGDYVVQEHVPPGLTVTGIGGSSSFGSWSCTPAAPQTGPVTITCTFVLPGNVQIFEGMSLPPLLVDVHVDAPPDPASGGYTNCAEVIKAGTIGGGAFVTGANPSCVTPEPLVIHTLPAVCIEKFLDWDGDGVRDPGERLVSGVEFDVTDTSQQSVGTLVSSDTEPVCLFTAPGTYLVSERLPLGWQATRPRNGRRRVRLRGDRVTLLTFGNRPLSELCVHKFEDIDADGVRDENEPLLSGWKFNVAGKDTASTLISGGDESCTSLVPGTYHVSEVMQPGWTATAPPSGVQTVQVDPVSSHIVTFGNTRRPCCLTFTYSGGRNDNFSTTGPVEPAALIPPATTALFFDEVIGNKDFGHRMEVTPGNCIRGAKLTARIKPIQFDAKNDHMFLKVPGGPIKDLFIPALTGLVWTPSDGPHTITLDLANLPGSGPTSIISSLNAFRKLDVTLTDDTSVDFLRLDVQFCPCSGHPIDDISFETAPPHTQPPLPDGPSGDET